MAVQGLDEDRLADRGLANRLPGGNCLAAQESGALAGRTPFAAAILGEDRAAEVDPVVDRIGLPAGGVRQLKAQDLLRVLDDLAQLPEPHAGRETDGGPGQPAEAAEGPAPEEGDRQKHQGADQQGGQADREHPAEELPPQRCPTARRSPEGGFLPGERPAGRGRHRLLRRAVVSHPLAVQEQQPHRPQRRE